MEGIGTIQFIIILIILAIMALPMAHVLISKRSHGGAKIGWFLAVFMFSIFAYIVFLIVTQSSIDESNKIENA